MFSEIQSPLRSYVRALGVLSIVGLTACSNTAVKPYALSQDEGIFGALPARDSKAMVDKAREKIELGGEARSAYTLLNEAKRYEEPASYSSMGRMYEGGQGVAPVDFIARDHYWFGALSGDGESMYQVALQQLAREETAKKSPAFMPKFQRWLRSQSGNPPPPSEGLNWMQRAAQTGHPQANLYLARHYFAKNDNLVAQSYLKVALKAGLPDAKHILAEHYERGTGGIDQDYKQAFAVLADLAKTDRDPKAMHIMGFYFVRGLHGVKDEVAAVHWYHEAAKAGYPDAMLAYAWMVENGVGTNKDPEEAEFYYQLAAKHGVKKPDLKS